MGGTSERPKRVAVFGHFGTTNFGNESTLSALLYHVRRLLPDAQLTCICTNPEAVASAHFVEALPISSNLLLSWVPRRRWAKLLRKLCVGIPSEPYRWVKACQALKGADLLVVPGTNLLTDIDGLLGYGPYNLFRWSLTARMRRCQVVFLSVGAGPIHGVLGRLLVRAALSTARSRSYRDRSTKEYLAGIGFRVEGDPVVPDLAFSLPEVDIPREGRLPERRKTVGLGLMADPWKYTTLEPAADAGVTYLESLVRTAEWFLGRGYDVRLLIGDRWDASAVQEFRRRLQANATEQTDGRIIETPLYSVQGLMSEIAATDIVVATRFHNVLFALLCDKPTIAVSFHHKCESLMRSMGLSDYCVDLDGVQADLLISTALKLEEHADEVKALIEERTRHYREELDGHYERVFGNRTRPASPEVDAPPVRDVTVGRTGAPAAVSVAPAEVD